MLKQAAAKQTAAAPKGTLQFHTSPRKPTIPFNKQASPLGPTSGNTVRVPNNSASRLSPKTAVNNVTKRTNSGLSRALSNQNGFDDLYPSLTGSTLGNSRLQSTPQQSPGGLLWDGVHFDENDLIDSDWELEAQEVITKPTPNPVVYPDLSAKVPLVSITASTDETNIDASQPLPWSSSPVAHFAIDTKKFRSEYNTSQVTHQAQIKPHTPQPSTKPRKRRLPAAWKEDEEVASHRKPTQPYMWDITQSALKQQQKTLRDAQKRIKVTETEDGKAKAQARKKRSSVARVFLSDEQQMVLNMVIEKQKSVFFTGSAGTGKSVLLREIIASLRKRHKEPDRVAITASTGLAACNIGGVTLHSFAGIGLGNNSVPELVKKIKRNPKAKHRWMRTKVLIIDEVSMVDGDLFDKLEAIARELRKNGRAFGGIQLIITGDFFQLPPVPERGTVARFAFNANSWNSSIEETIALHKVFRQKDPEFAGILNQMREGRLDPKAIAKFKSLNRELKFDDDLEATELFSTRAEVDRANHVRLNNLSGEARIFEARDGGSMDKEFRDKLLANVMAPQTITLKKGAQVMLIKNFDETLVNGSLGKVIGFMSESQFDNYQERDLQATQGGSLIDDDIPITKGNGKVIVDIEGAGARYPVVRFAISDGTTRDFLCKRESWSVEQPNGEVQASRSQIPLILAWALSIHKAQGQTLERVKVNLSRAFEKGQAYVALSRATSMAGLQVLGFDPAKVMAHESVRRFYASLSRLESNKAVKLGDGKEGKSEEPQRQDEYGDDDWHEWTV
jgi:ATP-dependent DNA helicase PIF1